MHKSTAIINAEPIGHCKQAATPQFRFVLRLAAECARQGVGYEMAWRPRYEDREDRSEMIPIHTHGPSGVVLRDPEWLERRRSIPYVEMKDWKDGFIGEPRRRRELVGYTATITVPDARGLTSSPKPLDKPKAARADWKPRPLEAGWRDDAGEGQKPGCKPERVSGFVIEHSSGLCLYRLNVDAEWNSAGGEAENPNSGWTVGLGGLGFGLAPMPIAKAAAALLFAAGLADWHILPADVKRSRQHRLAWMKTLAEFMREGYERADVRRRIEALEAAPAEAETAAAETVETVAA